jgi:hypothetical protein
MKEQKPTAKKDKVDSARRAKITLVPLGSVTKLTGGLFASGEAEYHAYYAKPTKEA